jgi:hypothetical protein
MATYKRVSRLAAPTPGIGDVNTQSVNVTDFAVVRRVFDRTYAIMSRAPILRVESAGHVERYLLPELATSVSVWFREKAVAAPSEVRFDEHSDVYRSVQGFGNQLSWLTIRDGNTRFVTIFDPTGLHFSIYVFQPKDDVIAFNFERVAVLADLSEIRLS